MDFALAGPGYSSVYIRRACSCAVDRKVFSLNDSDFFLIRNAGKQGG
jgi:hypothetical protein